MYDKDSTCIVKDLIYSWSWCVQQVNGDNIEVLLSRWFKIPVTVRNVEGNVKVTLLKDYSQFL